MLNHWGVSSGIWDGMRRQLHAVYIHVQSGMYAMSNTASTSQQLDRQHMDKLDPCKEIVRKSDGMKRKCETDNVSRGLCSEKDEVPVSLCPCPSCRIVRQKLENTAILSVLARTVTSTIRDVLFSANISDQATSSFSQIVDALKQCCSGLPDMVEKHTTGNRILAAQLPGTAPVNKSDKFEVESNHVRKY